MTQKLGNRFLLTHTIFSLHGVIDNKYHNQAANILSIINNEFLSTHFQLIQGLYTLGSQSSENPA